MKGRKKEKATFQAKRNNQNKKKEKIIKINRI